jgi:hypothetical protein
MSTRATVRLGPAARIGGFAAVLGAVFVTALVVGGLVGPSAEPAAPRQAHGHTEGQTSGRSHGTTRSAAAPALPGGLTSAQDGYRLVMEETVLAAGDDVPVAFMVEGPDGHAVSAYDVTHEKELHLVAARRDQSGFQHVHPRRDASGTWRSRLDLTPGSWRLFADFSPTGAAPLTLGTDLVVPGTFRPVAHPPSRTAEVDGYTVTLAGALNRGEESDLTLTVTQRGEPVTDLQPYLGAYGHLVTLRDGDLAYLHVHPHPSQRPGEPRLRFTAAVPSPGGYHLYLDFRHGGRVHTAAFSIPETDHAH